MNRSFFSYLILFCMLVACGDRSRLPTTPSNAAPTLERPAEGTTNYPSGALREEYEYFIERGEPVWHGAYRAFYKNGTVQTQGFFALGQRDSTWAFFDSTGRKTLEHTWKEGRRWNGPFTLYWPNGEISEHGFYREGIWHGAYTSYFQSGQTEIRTQYVDNQLHGTYAEYYETGARKLVGKYKDGFKNGLWTHYDEVGNVTLRERYEDGQLKGIEETSVELHDDGTVKSTAPLTDGKIDGVYSEYWPNGARREETTYVRGIANGESVIYWNNGKVREKGNNYNGRRQGVWLTFTRGGNLSIRATYSSGLLNRHYFSYYQNGNIKWQGVYNRNRKDGKWTNYAPSGEKRLVQYWDNNRLINGIDCRDDPGACE